MTSHLPPPHEDALRDAIHTWRDAQTAETTVQNTADTDKANLQTAQENYNQSRGNLEIAHGETEQRQKEVDALLETVTNESLVIEGPDDVTLFQGVSATFKADKRYAVDDHLVYPFWETAGLPITSGQGTYEINVDTSSVGPGDYDINVTLRPV